MKQGSFSRVRRLGSAMGRIAVNGPHVDAKSVFAEAARLAVTRRLVASNDGAHAFADAFLVAWFRTQGRRDRAKLVRRRLRAQAVISGGVTTAVLGGAL